LQIAALASALVSDRNGGENEISKQKVTVAKESDWWKKRSVNT
jgi:hypothetical protein